MQGNKKSVTILISDTDLAILKNGKYKLCLAKKVDDFFTVVWQAYDSYLISNTFSWTPQYQLFCSIFFEPGLKVKVSTNSVTIDPGEKSTLSSIGILSHPATGGATLSINLDNNYGSIYPGLCQAATGIDGKRFTIPNYVDQYVSIPGIAQLTPVEKLLVWFEQNIESSTMFVYPTNTLPGNSRSNYVEIDLTLEDAATVSYKDGKWAAG